MWKTTAASIRWATYVSLAQFAFLGATSEHVALPAIAEVQRNFSAFVLSLASAIRGA